MSSCVVEATSATSVTQSSNSRLKMRSPDGFNTTGSPLRVKVHCRILCRKLDPCSCNHLQTKQVHEREQLTYEKRRNVLRVTDQRNQKGTELEENLHIHLHCIFLCSDLTNFLAVASQLRCSRIFKYSQTSAIKI